MFNNLVQATGLTGIGNSTAGKLCKNINDRINAFLDRPLIGNWPCEGGRSERWR